MSKALFNSQFRIRRALVRDAGAAFSIWWDAKDLIGVTPHHSEASYRDLWRMYCRSGAVWVADVNGEIGSVLYVAGNDLFYLATAEQYRKRGLARSLIAQAKKLGRRRHYSEMTAKTKDTNAKTRALLESEGFVEIADDPINDNWKRYRWVVE